MNPQSTAAGAGITVHSAPRHAWIVPFVLLVAVTITLLLKWPMYAALLIAYLGSITYSARQGASFGALLRATVSGMRKMWKVCVVLLLIGGVMSLWMTTGTIPSLIDLATRFVHGANILWMSFVCSALLSLTVGSAIATWSVLGPTFMVMASPHMAPWIAGAILSGGMVGDRSSPMSTSALLVSTTCERPPSQTLGQLNRTALIPILLCTGLWWILNQNLPWFANSPALPAAHHGVTLWLGIVPPLIVIALSLSRVPLIHNFVITFLFAVFCSVIIVHLPLGVPLHEVWFGSSYMDDGHVSRIGGILRMLSAVLLILSAGAFQGVTELGGSISHLSHQMLTKIQGKGPFLVMAYAIALVFSLVMGSQMLAILMSASTLKPEFEARGLGTDSLVQVVGDASELLPALIPWNLLGFQASIILATPSLAILLHAYFIYVMLACSIGIVCYRSRVRDSLA